MRGRLAAGRIAAVVLGALIAGMGVARSAHAALEWELPGERKLSIHGFYEMRLLVVGEDLPANDVTFSQFRHVVSAELEFSIAPDGFGPFDSIFLFARGLASFDCIYSHACGIWSSADSYGPGTPRIVRQPASLKQDVVNKSPYFGGLLPLQYVPGSLASPVEVLNPSRRYRDCINPPATFQNPFPLAVFCNLNQRSPLDPPIKPLGVPLVIQPRAGTFWRQGRENLLTAARPSLGETEFERLRSLLLSGSVLSASEEGERRALLAQAYQAEKAGDKQAAKDLRAQADAILGSSQTDFDANFTELLRTRPDPNRFAIFSRSINPQILQSQWGSNKIGDAILPFLGSINTPIQPKGYFDTSASLNWFGQYEAGIADDMTFAQLTGAPDVTDADGINKIIDPQLSVKKAIPFFVGPDGLRDTADDLPYVRTNDAAQAAGYVLAPPISGTTQDRFDVVTGSGVNAIPNYTATAQITVPTAADPTTTKLVELYGVYNPNFVRLNGCQLGLGGTYNRQTNVCTVGGQDVSDQALARGCSVIAQQNKTTRIDIGVNADGDCIEVNTSSPVAGSTVQYEVLGLLSDLRARPGQASNEPLDATDLRLYGNEGVQLPARPRSKTNGIVFQSPGAANFYTTHQAVVSQLDLYFNVDELQWNHGASQQEREFAEGYLEFEMLDSQVFARVGKQLVIWGKTELFRNQDRNNPLDIGNGLFGPLDEQRVGQWAADITISPEMFMRVGPVEDLRLELLWIFNKFTPTDLGKCGEGASVELICLKSFGAIANGLSGIGILGETRPSHDYHGLATYDYGVRMEGRFDRFTFAVSDFWGWDDGFVLNLEQQYQRTADFTTGSPLATNQIQQGGHCVIRTNSKGQPVGPDGIPGTGDDIFPSEGNCLLWGKPEVNPNDPNGPLVQHLRAPGAIASLQNVNQTLFHSICSFTFDQDEGYCAFDRLNNPEQFGFISAILGGLGNFGGIVIDGLQFIRRSDSPLDSIASPTQLTDQFRNFQFMPVNPKAQQDDYTQDLGFNLQPEQAALLGCGPAYAIPCSEKQGQQWATDPSIVNSLKRDPNDPPPTFGGIDLMNADGSVVTMEFVGLKALSPGALVGTRTDKTGTQVYLPGMNYSRNGTFVSVPNTPAFPPPAIEVGDYLPITPNQVIKLGRVGRAEFQNEQDPNGLQADGWIEPMPWKIDPKAKQKWGAIVFQNDPNAPFSLTSPLNVWNTIDKKNTHPTAYDQIDGEYCARWMNGLNNDAFTPFNHGCTVLETASANFERLLISTEIIGFDRAFDPPESLTELTNWGRNDTSIQETGDPISGPDGIFLNNQFVFNDEEMDFEVSPLANPNVIAQVVEAPANKADARAFLDNYDPNVSCSQALCFLNVTNTLSDKNDAKSIYPLVLTLPIGFTVNHLDEPNDPNLPSNVIGAIKVNLAALQDRDRNTLLDLFAGKRVMVNGQFMQMTPAQRALLFAKSDISTGNLFDLNLDGINDLDQDKDGVWDSQDDYSPGPVTDDNILCGTGLRGDPFQEAAQYEPYRLDEAPGSAKFKAKFPKGLPPRSPVFCRSVVGILGATTQTQPVRKAGGDGRYGRRDFLWQGGRQVSLGYQKKNVLGFGLDFAEDVTKTSWGIEFSWMARKLIGNSLTYSNYSQSDELVLSISVDRPTFFNFLNPNRSFFMNLQMFIRYLPNYQGGKLNRDGNYAYAGNPFSGNIVFTFFTGYFQDRLAPRMSILYAPLESQGAVITGLSYRWNDAFTTSIGYSNFFGHVYKSQGAYFPIAQYGSVQNYDSAILGRGVAPVLNHDQAELRFRYTW